MISRLNSVIVGDALTQIKELETDSVDLCITSPPYNKRRDTRGWLVRNPAYTHLGDYIPEEDYQQQQIGVINELFRVIKPGGSLFYNHKLRWDEGLLIHPLFWLAKTQWALKQEIIWDRGIAANMRGWRFWQVDERIYWLYKPHGRKLTGSELDSRHAKLSSIWRMKPVNRSDRHPAPFPLELPTRIIASLLSQPGVVIDPYCGSGTTLVAAKLLTHKFIGIDISPTYALTARERIDNSEQERVQVSLELAKHVIIDSFAQRKKRGRESWPYGPDSSSIVEGLNLDLDNGKS